MKIFVVNTDYQAFIEKDYQSNFGLEKKTFSQQLQHRYNTLFGVANFYSKNLEKLGHQAIDIFANHKYLQLQWARENSFRLRLKNYFSWSNWQDEILTAQIKAYKPDVIINLAMDSIGGSFFLSLKRSQKIFLVGQHAAALNENVNDLESYDLIISSIPNLVKYFDLNGKKSAYLRLGFENSILDKLPKEKEKKYSVVHIGGLTSVHNKRGKILNSLSRNIPIDFWGYGENSLSKSSSILRKFHGFVGGREMYDILRQAKIAVNIHSSVSKNYANNMRLFETTGVGTLLITDTKINLGKLFKIGEEVVTYDNSDDLVDKIKYYLVHDKEREKIARAGQLRTFKEHAYAVRMKELLDILKKNM